MTCASPSLRTSPANSHVTENPHFLAHIQIPVMCCLGTLVLSRLASSFTHRIPFTMCIHRGRCSDGRRGRRCRNDAGSYVGRRVGWASNTRDAFALISDAGCYMSKPRTRFWKVAHAAQVTYRSPLCDSTFLSLHLFVSCAGPLRSSMRHMPVETCQVLRNRTSVLDVK
jgi:hypothetical protein